MPNHTIDDFSWWVGGAAEVVVSGGCGDHDRVGFVGSVAVDDLGLPAGHFAGAPYVGGTLLAIRKVADVAGVRRGLGSLLFDVPINN